MYKGSGSEGQTGNKSFSYECQLEMRAARQQDKQAARWWYKDWEKYRKKGGTLQPKNTFLGCSRIREDSRTMNHEFQNAKAAKVLVFSAKFTNKQHQHFNICVRSALEAHSSQLGSECLSCGAL